MFLNGEGAAWHFIQRQRPPPPYIAEEVERCRRFAISQRQGITTRPPTTLEQTEAMQVLHGAIFRPGASGLQEKVEHTRPATPAMAAPYPTPPPSNPPSEKSVHLDESVRTQLKDRQQSLRMLVGQVENQLSRPSSRDRRDDARVRELLERCQLRRSARRGCFGSRR